MFRRVGILASLTVLVAMVAAVPTAHAQSGGVCAFEGLAGDLTPSIPAWVNDVGLLDFEQGTYVYGGPARCAGKFGADVIAPAGPGPNVEISSFGYYDSQICGTGFAHDTSGANTVVEQTVGGSARVDNVGYEIAFSGGQGVILIGQGAIRTAAAGAPPHGSGGSSSFHGPWPGAFQGEGVVQIVPTDGNCVTTDVSAFLVNGSFVVV